MGNISYGYFPGCSQKGSSKEYEISLLKVMNALGVSLDEINDWSCCGATSGHFTSHRLANALAMRNIALAEDQGYQELVAPCAACYNRLISAKNEFRSHGEVKADAEDLLNAKIRNEIGVYNVIEMFMKIGIEKIIENRVRELDHLKAACYYGCLLLRPGALTKFDDTEQPSTMEKIVEATGAKTVDWNFKLECCGAALSIARRDIVVDLSKKIIDDAIRHGANVIIVACPMCHTNLDMRQRVMKRTFKDYHELPVLYITELIGLAMGMSGKEVGIDKHFIKFNCEDNLIQASPETRVIAE